MMKRLAISLLLFKHDMISGNSLPSFRLSSGGSSYSESDRFPSLTEGELEYEKMSLPSYYFRITDIDTFRTFWAACDQTTWHKSLLLAGKRLLQTQACEGESAWEDRLIDLMIACEALILKGENAKGQNIAHRVGKLQKEKISHLEKRAVEELGIAYGLRNDAVHDGEFSSAKLAKVQVPFPEQFMVSIERYLRIGMINYIDLMNQGQSKEQIIQYLDSLPRAV
jgi:hypothetical protein